MKEQYQHKFMTSFMLWADDLLLDKAGYDLKTGELFLTTDDRVDSSYNVYGSSYKQWSMSIPDGPYFNKAVTWNGIYGLKYAKWEFPISGIIDWNDNVYNRDSGVIIDYNNGRVLVPTGISLTSPVALENFGFVVKEVNTYFTNESEEDIVLRQDHYSNSVPTGAAEPYDNVLPAVFFSTDGLFNEPFAFGGMQTTNVMAKAVVVADSPYTLDGILSIFADSQHEVIKQIPMSGYPLTFNGDLKPAFHDITGYTYDRIKTQYEGNPCHFINKVRTSKLTDKSSENGYYVGFVDFDIEQHRYRFS